MKSLTVEGKPMEVAMRMIDQEEWAGHVDEAIRAHQTVPETAVAEMSALIAKIGDVFYAHKVSPRAMAAMSASLFGLLALAEAGGNPFAESTYEDFSVFSAAAIEVATARARLAAGWRDGKPH